MAIPKIARGSSGQVDLVDNLGQDCDPAYQYYDTHEFDFKWRINEPNNGNEYPGPYGGRFADQRSPRGWSYSGGSVGVPNSADEGLYYVVEQTYEGGGCISAKGGYIQVVCMTTEITVMETYRDEDKYRLSCTATAQGGTAPYTYNWSSTVTGSQALSALNQATLEVEIPAIGNGSISVTVSDSSDPVCTASASFDVCGYVTCEFTTALISTPPTGDTGPYIYECVSSSLSGFGDLIYEWSPGPIEVSADGKVAKFSFPDDDEHSIHLSVKDASGCRGFKTHQVGGYEFTISTDPSGEDTGTVSGTRDTMEFNVTVTAQATGNFVGTPPAQLTLEFSRPAINGVGTVTAPLVTGSNPPRYEFDWRVTSEKGRWQIKALGVRSNTVTFKIDKRKQIVEVANSWVGADRNSVTLGANCEDVVGTVYSHLGLAMNASTPTLAGESAPLNNSQPGSIILYHSRLIPTTPWQHVGINVGASIVDQNCGSHPGNAGNTLVCSHAADAPHLQSVTPTLDHYSVGPIYKGTQEMEDLDNE